VNEGVSVPTRLIRGKALPPGRLSAALTADADRLASLGARLVRAHTGAFPRTSMRELDATTRAHLDAWVRTVQAAGLEPIGMVSPWPANQTATFTDRYVPADLDAYAAYVRAQVERYDHDGIDDMPGLTAPVRYWEVDNEPDLKFTRPPRGRDGSRPPRDTLARPDTGFCRPEEYAAVLVASARAIRAASADARVLGLGLYAPAHAESYLDAVLAVPGARDALDVVSLHTYAEDDGASLVAGIRTVRARLPTLPVWVTETSASSEHDADRQARILVARVARSAEAGAEALLWHTLADPPPGAGVGRAHNSLLEGDAAPDPGAERPLREKPAARAYRALARVLAEHDLVGATAAAPGRTRLVDGSLLLWSGSAPAPHGGIDLRDGRPLAEGAMATAPAWMR
jgi:hypothetical protein